MSQALCQMICLSLSVKYYNKPVSLVILLIYANQNMVRELFHSLENIGEN